MALTLGDNFSYQGAKPLDARLKYDTLAAMKAVADATMYDGCMAYCSATDKTYQWKSTNTVDESTGKWREFSSGGGGGSTYTAGDGIDITDDTISVDEMPSEDMSEVISPLPSIQPRYHKYSTEEQIVGTWIDGSTVYEKTIIFDDFSNPAFSDATQSRFVITHNLNIETYVDCFCYLKNQYSTLTKPSGRLIPSTFMYEGTSTYSLEAGTYASINADAISVTLGKRWVESNPSPIAIIAVIRYTKIA